MAKFKTQARVLDLLGRQQIAGIPTAINEIFKNAHDAYADHVEVDFLRAKRTLIIRDDGLGMTYEDFLSRWLVLGTESKVANGKLAALPMDPEKPKRPVMGEKGIGRLAIATLGSQVLVVSRAKRQNRLESPVVAFINWRIFEIPGLDLDDVVIPVMKLEDKAYPDDDDLDIMKSELCESLAELAMHGHIDEDVNNQLQEEIFSFPVIFSFGRDALPGEVSFANTSGTHFYVAPVSEALDQDIDKRGTDKEEASRLEKMLIGFSNTMAPEASDIRIQTTFRDHRSDDRSYRTVASADAFFTQEDFKKADHTITGRFDEFGQFTGDVSIYNKHLIRDHKIVWNGNGFKVTKCGPFRITFAYMQGAERQSGADSITFAQLNGKLDKFGGLYLYRDNIRILPYGDSDYDFVDIEKRRNKSAGYYFFSYRRIFGAIETTREQNSHLQEKAGREGFIENKAYKQLREIIMNFFVQLAADFFRDKGDGVYVHYWQQAREEREKIYSARERKKKQSREKKAAFYADLSRFFAAVDRKKIEGEMEDFFKTTEDDLAALSIITDPDEAAARLLEQEVSSRNRLRQIEEAYRIKAPRGFALSKDGRREWESYLAAWQRLEAGLFSESGVRLAGLVDQFQGTLNVKISKRRRISENLKNISKEAERALRTKRREIQKTDKRLSGKIREITHELMEGVEKELRVMNDALPKITVEKEGDGAILDQMKRLETPIIEMQEYAVSTLDTIIEQLDSITWERDKTGKIIPIRVVEEVMEEEIEELREQSLNDSELIQIGLAIKIVQHEFSTTVNAMRSGIKELKRWSAVDERIQSIYETVRLNFEHLDDYLKILMPYDRRLYRSREKIKGEEIYIFLLDVFRVRKERHRVSIKRTGAFRSAEIKGYRSIFYPVFVNIADNAFHWLAEVNEERVIGLHFYEGSFFISNNGPSVSERDYEKIFELGFTRKANGRGMGLAVSRQVLRSHGWDIALEAPPLKNASVTFRIFPLSDEEGE